MTSNEGSITVPFLDKSTDNQEIYDIFDNKNINSKRSFAILQKYEYNKGLLAKFKVDPTKGLDTKDIEDINSRKKIYGTNEPIPIKFDSFCKMVQPLLRCAHNSKTK
jgi:hypothetical protein